MKINFFYIFLIFFISCRKPSNISPYLNVYNDIEYVGINTCKQCHMDIYNTFIKNGMGKSFNVAQKEFSSSEFKHPIFDSILGFHYFPEWIDNELFLNEYQLKFNDTVFSLKTKIDYIVGSGNHTNSHIINSNGYLYQAPFTFYTQDSILDFPPGFEYGNNQDMIGKLD